MRCKTESLRCDGDGVLLSQLGLEGADETNPYCEENEHPRASGVIYCS